MGEIKKRLTKPSAQTFLLKRDSAIRKKETQGVEINEGFGGRKRNNSRHDK